MPSRGTGYFGMAGCKSQALRRAAGLGGDGSCATSGRLQQSSSQGSASSLPGLWGQCQQESDLG